MRNMTMEEELEQLAKNRFDDPDYWLYKRLMSGFESITLPNGDKMPTIKILFQEAQRFAKATGEIPCREYPSDAPIFNAAVLIRENQEFIDYLKAVVEALEEKIHWENSTIPYNVGEKERKQEKALKEWQSCPSIPDSIRPHLGQPLSQRLRQYTQSQIPVHQDMDELIKEIEELEKQSK